MLKINDLKVSLEEEAKQIIKGLSLSINPGEVHAIMGPNGSGKSTLSSVLAGKDGYIIDSGTVNFDGSDLLEAEVEERAALGIFMAFQYPIEIPGSTHFSPSSKPLTPEITFMIVDLPAPFLPIKAVLKP